MDREMPQVKKRRSWVVHQAACWLNDGRRRDMTLCGLWAPRDSRDWIDVPGVPAGGLRYCAACKKQPAFREAA